MNKSLLPLVAATTLLSLSATAYARRPASEVPAPTGSVEVSAGDDASWFQRLTNWSRSGGSGEGQLGARSVRVAFVARRDDFSVNPIRWEVRGRKKARLQFFESIRDLSGVALAEAIAAAEAKDLDVLLERLRNVRLEIAELETSNLAAEVKEAKLRKKRATEERLSRNVQDTALEMKMALFSSLR